jgi:hypothetical protein
VISPSQRPLPTQDNTTYKQKRQTSKHSAGFDPAIPATKRPQTYALDRASTGHVSLETVPILREWHKTFRCSDGSHDSPLCTYYLSWRQKSGVIDRKLNGLGKCVRTGYLSNKQADKLASVSLGTEQKHYCQTYRVITIEWAYHTPSSIKYWPDALFWK